MAFNVTLVSELAPLHGGGGGGYNRGGDAGGGGGGGGGGSGDYGGMWRSKLVCFGCRATGHSLRDCRQAKGGAAASAGGARGKAAVQVEHISSTPCC